MKTKEIYLRSDKAREIVQFIPSGDHVTLVKMHLSLTGVFSPYTKDTTRAKLTLIEGRKSYATLRASGFTPW